MPHATTVGPFTRFLWNNQIWPASGSVQENRVLLLPYLVGWGTCLFHLLPICAALRGGGSPLRATEQPESVLWKIFAQMLQLLVAPHSFGAAVDPQMLAAFRHGRAWCFATIPCSHVVLDLMSKIRKLPNYRSTFTHFSGVQSAIRVCQ